MVVPRARVRTEPLASVASSSYCCAPTVSASVAVASGSKVIVQSVPSEVQDVAVQVSSVALSRTVAPGNARAWSVPWIGLLPRLAALGARPNPGPQGTALNPFPRG